MNATEQTTSSSSKSVLLKRLDSLDALLRETRQAVLELLAKHSSSEVHDLRYALFAHVCDGLYEAAKAFEFGKSDVDFPFYVWPGYNSIRYTDPSRQRVQLSAQWDASNTDDILCGISPAYDVTTLLNQSKRQHPDDDALRDYSESQFRNALEGICTKRKSWDCLTSEVQPTPGLTSLQGGVFRLLANPCSVFFSVLLHHPAPPGCDFIPGSTHRWFLENKKLKTKDEQPLRGLAIHYADSADSGPGSATYFPIHLTAGDLTASGTHIGGKIDGIKDIRLPWPVPAYGSPDHGNVNDLLLRRRLYSPWLTSVFAPHCIVGTGSPRWEEFWSDADKNITPPAYLTDGFALGKKRLDQLPVPLRALLLYWSQYNHWISLALDEAPGATGAKVALGSVMLFSKKPLSAVFLTKVRNWIQELYLLLRQHESTQMAEESGAAENRKMQEFRLAHETRTMAGALIRGNQPIIRETVGRQLIAQSYRAEGEDDRRFSEREDLRTEWPAAYAIEAGSVSDWLKSITTTAALITKLGDEAANVVALGAHLETTLNTFIAEELATFTFSPECSFYQLSPYFPNPARKFLVRAWIAAMCNYFKHRLRKDEAVGPPCKFVLHAGSGAGLWRLAFTNRCAAVASESAFKLGTGDLLLEDLVNAFRWRDKHSFRTAGVFGSATEQDVRSCLAFAPQPSSPDVSVTAFVTQLPMPHIFFQSL